MTLLRALPFFALFACGPQLESDEPLDSQSQALGSLPLRAVNFACVEGYYNKWPAERVRAFDLMKQAGIRGVRIPVGWNAVEPAQDTWALTNLDSCVQLAAERSIKVVIVVVRTADWATVTGLRGSGDNGGIPRDPALFGAAMKHLAEHYVGRIHGWELYNETSIPFYWAGTTDQYVAALKAGSAAVRQADPQAKVLLAGVAGNFPGYLQSLCTAGACGIAADGRPIFDIASVHLYPYNTVTDVPTLLGSVVGMHAVVPDRPMWLNEFGWHCTDGDLPCLLHQANVLREAYAYLADKPYVGWATWFPLEKHTSDGAGWEDYSLLLGDLSPRPSYDAMASLAAGTVPAELVPPSAASSLAASQVGSTSVTLSWAPAYDASGISGYRVYSLAADGSVWTRAGAANGTTLALGGLTASTTYRFAVVAVDRAGNVSALPSNTISVTTRSAADTTPPTVPQQLRFTQLTAYSVSLAWNASTDDVGVVRYRVQLRVPGGAFQVVATPTGTSFTVTGLNPSTAYELTVQAVDAAGNRSAPSSVLAITTLPAAIDGTPPTAPQQLRATQLSATALTLAWNASTDNVGVRDYRVYSKVGAAAWQLARTVTGLGVSFSGLTPSTGYQFYVVATDAAGNVSAPSSTLTVTTPASTGDTTAPTPPGNFSAHQTFLKLVGSMAVAAVWSASSDNVGVTSYRLLARTGGAAWQTMATVSGTTTYVTAVGFQPSTVYEVAAVAVDAAGNVSGTSNVVRVETTAMP